MVLGTDKSLAVPSTTSPPVPQNLSWRHQQCMLSTSGDVLSGRDTGVVNTGQRACLPGRSEPAGREAGKHPPRGGNMCVPPASAATPGGLLELEVRLGTTREKASSLKCRLPSDGKKPER